VLENSIDDASHSRGENRVVRGGSEERKRETERKVKTETVKQKRRGERKRERKRERERGGEEEVIECEDRCESLTNAENKADENLPTSINYRQLCRNYILIEYNEMVFMERVADDYHLIYFGSNT